jgi:predicted nucleic acid-binding protein
VKNILIDSDVILDFFFDRKPFSQKAAQLLTLCEKKTINGFVTPVIISNVYYLLTQNAKHEKAIEKLSILCSIVDVLPMDKNIVLKALNSEFKDFEDALQNYAAEQKKNIDIVITRNTKDYKNSILAIMHPDEYLELKLNT